MHNQPGADAEHGGLQHVANDLRDAAEPTGDIGSPEAGRDVPVIGPLEQPADPPVHPERRHCLRIAARGLDQGGALPGRAGDVGARPPRQHFGQKREHDQDCRAGHQRPAEIGMQHEAQRAIERDPGQIEQRGRPQPGQKATDAVEIARQLAAARSAPQLSAKDGAEHRSAELTVELDTDTAQNALAQPVEHTEQDVERSDDQREGNKRRHAARRQHPVIDLQHVERARQHQHVDEGGKQRHREESGTARGQSLAGSILG